MRSDPALPGKQLVSGDFNKGTHDKLVKELVQRLEQSSVPYEFVDYNVTYSTQSNTVGEVDVWARFINPRTYSITDLVFEVKSNGLAKNVLKAEGQLDRHAKHWNPRHRAYFFVFTPGDISLYL